MLTGGTIWVLTHGQFFARVAEDGHDGHGPNGHGNDGHDATANADAHDASRPSGSISRLCPSGIHKSRVMMAAGLGEFHALARLFWNVWPLSLLVMEQSCQGLLDSSPCQACQRCPRTCDRRHHRPEGQHPEVGRSIVSRVLML